MNITIIYDHISYITYISQLSSTSPILYQFPINACRNIYVVSIYNKDHSLTSSAVQLIRGKQKRDISSSVMITLAQRYPSTLTSLEEHLALFDQAPPLLEPTIRHNGVLPPLPLINLPIFTKPSR